METIEERNQTIIEEFRSNVALDLSLNNANKQRYQTLLKEVLNSEIERFRDELNKQFYGADNKEGVKSIIKHVCETNGITVEEMLRKNRKKEIREPRQIIHWMIRSKVTPNTLSLEAIGNLVGKKNHATVLHSYRTVNNMIETEHDFRENLMRMCNELGAKTRWIPDGKNKGLTIVGYLNKKQQPNNN